MARSACEKCGEAAVHREGEPAVCSKCAEALRDAVWHARHDDAPKKVLRLPMLDEFVKAGYTADLYDKFIAHRREEAALEGAEAIVMPLPPEEEALRDAVRLARYAGVGTPDEPIPFPPPPKPAAVAPKKTITPTRPRRKG